MREIAALTFIILDGVMQAVSLPEEYVSDGFAAGGWATDYWDHVMEQVQREAMAKPYDMLLGQKTYELFAGHQGSSMNNGQVYVVSSELADLKWKNTTLLSGDVVSALSKFKKQNGPLLQVHGSW